MNFCSIVQTSADVTFAASSPKKSARADPASSAAASLVKRLSAAGSAATKNICKSLWNLYTSSGIRGFEELVDADAAAEPSPSVDASYASASTS